MQNFIRLSRSSTQNVLRTVIQANTSNSSSNNNNNSPPSSPSLSLPHKPHAISNGKSQSLSSDNSPLIMSGNNFRFHSKLCNQSNSNAKYDASTKKYILLGLGSEVLIELCAEGLFFEVIPREIYNNTMTLVLGSEHVRRRIGRHLYRKPSHFGLWLDENSGENQEHSNTLQANQLHGSQNQVHGSQVDVDHLGATLVDGKGNLMDNKHADIKSKRKHTTAIASYNVKGELGSAKIIFEVALPEAGEKRLILLMAEFSNSDKYILYELNEKPQPPAM